MFFCCCCLFFFPFCCFLQVNWNQLRWKVRPWSGQGDCQRIKNMSVAKWWLHLGIQGRTGSYHVSSCKFPKDVVFARSLLLCLMILLLDNLSMVRPVKWFVQSYGVQSVFSFIWPVVKKGSLCARQIQNQHGDAWLGQETKEWDSRAHVAVQVSSSKAGLFRGVCDSGSWVRPWQRIEVARKEIALEWRLGKWAVTVQVVFSRGVRVERESEPAAQVWSERDMVA